MLSLNITQGWSIKQEQDRAKDATLGNTVKKLTTGWHSIVYFHSLVTVRQIWSEPLECTVNDAKTIWNTMQKNLEINCVERWLKIQWEQYHAGILVNGSEYKYIILNFNQCRKLWLKLFSKELSYLCSRCILVLYLCELPRTRSDTCTFLLL